MKSFTVLVFLCVLLKANAQTKDIYLLSLIGQSPKENKISLEISLRATQVHRDCQTMISFQGQNTIQPHMYKITNFSLADYQGLFSIDIDLDRNLKDQIEENIMDSMIDLEMSAVSSYMNRCKFKVYMVTVNSNDSTLIVRNSRFINLKNKFEVPYSRLKTVDFSFHSVKKILFNIIFLDKQQSIK